MKHLPQNSADVSALTPAEREVFAGLDPQRLPQHIAIIMDGNGRWANQRHLPRVMGHRSGVQSVRSVVEAASNIRLPFLTMYAFSAENWKRRPRAEVEFLMQLLRQYLKIEVPRMNRHNVRLKYIGRVHELPDSVQERMKWAEDATSSNTGTVMTLALNYGARTELVDAFRSIITAAQNNGGIDHVNIDEDLVSRHLYSGDMPDPDLVIRTSGELRVSNFLLWQIAYAEIYVTEKLWPDFQGVDLLHAIADYQGRERRYGGLAANAGVAPEGTRAKLIRHARRAHTAGKALLTR
jgi:undecaprenyl diphosphate synthase